MISSQTVTITLDGLDVSGHPGMTILELARESGIYIPTLCSDPNLAPIGACRICVVQDERNGSIMASCVTPIASGMIINTKSPSVIEHRKNIISLLLASHPDTCMVCDKGNICQLRQIAADLGIGLTRMYRIPQKAEIIDLNPFIERDLSKCILCGKCIRADQELVVEGAIDYFERGFIARPATFGNSPLELSECTFCGTCVAVCPTGALSEKKKTYRGTPGKSVDTICPYCACGCSLSAETKDNSVIRVRPSKVESVNRGTACVLGSYGLDFVKSPERLTRPLIKIEGNLVETDWENALDKVAAGLKEIIEKHGNQSIVVQGSSKCTNEENYVLQKFARCVLGTGNIDNGSSIANSPVTDSDRNILESMLYSEACISESDIILILGTNLESSAPVAGYAVKRAVKSGKAKLVLIDPVHTTISNLAEIWLRPEPGTEEILLNGVIKAIIEEGLFNREYISSRADNFEQLVKALDKFTFEKIEKDSGISREQIIHLARIFGRAKKPLVIFGQDLNISVKQTLINLMVLTDNSKGKNGVLPVYSENNSLGACDMGALPRYLPGYVPVNDVALREKFGEYWKLKVPAEGIGIEEIKSGKIKCFYIMGENPAGSLPAQIMEAFSAAEFTVVQDIFLSDTARLADVVLPASTFAEKEGTFTNMWGRVQKLNKFIAAAGESLPDWEIVTRLAAKMNAQFPYASVGDIQREIGELVPLYSQLASMDKAGYFDTAEARNKNADKKLTKKYQFTIPAAPGAKKKDTEKEVRFTLIAEKKLTDFGTGTRVSRTSRIPVFHHETV